jgi:hypothetical protein
VPSLQTGTSTAGAARLQIEGIKLGVRSTLGSTEMAKGQIKKNTGNKPKLSVKEKKQKKKEKAAKKASG